MTIVSNSNFELPPDWPCPFERHWTFFFTNVQQKQYDTHFVLTISNVKEFWGLFNSISPISTVTKYHPNLNYHLMLKDLPPSWLSPGGTIRINLTYENFWKYNPVSNQKDVLFELYIHSCALLVSENVDEISNIVTGVSVRNSCTTKDIKGKPFKSCAALTFWTSEKPSESMLETLKNNLPQLHKSSPTYKSNNERI